MIEIRYIPCVYSNILVRILYTCYTIFFSCAITEHIYIEKA